MYSTAREFSVYDALRHGWSFGSIDRAVRDRFVVLFRKAGKLYLRLT